jgi:hypothetical protein
MFGEEFNILREFFVNSTPHARSRLMPLGIRGFALSGKVLSICVCEKGTIPTHGGLFAYTQMIVSTQNSNYAKVQTFALSQNFYYPTQRASDYEVPGDHYKSDRAVARTTWTSGEIRSM